MIPLRLLAVFMATLLTGCSTMKPEDFSATEPPFYLESYFEGRTHASGMFEDRFGNLRRRFTVDITGVWDGSILTLTEDFVYDDGETEQRVWTIRKIDDNTYEGEAENVIGTAIGKRFGSALNWQYKFDLKVGDSIWRVRFDDWMFLMPDGVMLNRATVTKWGVEIGSATIAFIKPQVEAERAVHARSAAE